MCVWVRVWVWMLVCVYCICPLLCNREFLFVCVCVCKKMYVRMCGWLAGWPAGERSLEKRSGFGIPASLVDRGEAGEQRGAHTPNM